MRLEGAERHLAAALGGVVDWRWGGGAAAQRLTRYFRGERTVVYLAEKRSDLGKRLGLVRDAVGPIFIAASPGPLAFTGPEPERVHPLIAYADLLAENEERAREAARELYQRYLSKLVGEP